MTERLPLETEAKVMQLLGISPDEHNSAAAVAIKCSWDMGYRRPRNLAIMAKRILVPPQT